MSSPPSLQDSVSLLIVTPSPMWLVPWTGATSESGVQGSSTGQTTPTTSCFRLSRCRPSVTREASSWMCLWAIQVQSMMQGSCGTAQCSIRPCTLQLATTSLQMVPIPAWKPQWPSSHPTSTLFTAGSRSVCIDALQHVYVDLISLFSSSV